MFCFVFLFYKHIKQCGCFSIKNVQCVKDAGLTKYRFAPTQKHPSRLWSSDSMKEATKKQRIYFSQEPSIYAHALHSLEHRKKMEMISLIKKAKFHLFYCLEVNHKNLLAILFHFSVKLFDNSLFMLWAGHLGILSVYLRICWNLIPNVKGLESGSIKRLVHDARFFVSGICTLYVWGSEFFLFTI